MSIIIDLIVLGIIALFTFIGYKQGLVKSAIKILSFFIAIIVAFVLYKPVSLIIIKNTTVDENIKSVIVENVKLEEKEDTQDSNLIKDTLSKKIVAGANNTVEDIADAFTVKIIEICVMILLYIIARIVLKFISALTELITNLPILKQINETGGLIYGLLKGVLIVCVILAIIYLIAPVTKPNTFDIIDETMLTKYIYNNNILLTIIF